MKKKLALLFPLFILIHIFSINARENNQKLFNPGPGWEFLGEKNDKIKVYRKEMDGTGIYAFRGMAILDWPLKEVLTIGTDISLAKNWTDSLKKLEIIRQISNNQWILYGQFHAPFPLSDRDFVFSATIEKRNSPRKGVEIKYVSQNERPEDDDHVRGDITGSVYRYLDIGQGTKTFVDFEIHCNPKGYIPSWIVNFFQKSWPKATINRFKEELEKGHKRVAQSVDNFLSE